MAIFLVTFGFFLLIVVAMAVGYIFQQKSLAGSCGGLSTIGIDKACNCDNPCEKRQERERKEALQESQKIDIKNL
ncbi:(Na+)-NQR maturation NqrM [Thalassotalea sediminis]|uniref:(Na+)-NQR maturation NqrM n=1 Tax=Thalassotalea sediminis TaxID=1759089 RepID=UPI002574822E|nr:(Na+)-NQR maturation NqrM [Thalassotalea sediminis]